MSISILCDERLSLIKPFCFIWLSLAPQGRVLPHYCHVAVEVHLPCLASTDTQGGPSHYRWVGVLDPHVATTHSVWRWHWYCRMVVRVSLH